MLQFIVSFDLSITRKLALSELLPTHFEQAVFSFLSFPPDAIRLFLSVSIVPDAILLFLLRILPAPLRLLSVPAPHCPVPASSASGLLSLLAPPGPVRATSDGSFFLCPLCRLPSGFPFISVSPLPRLPVSPLPRLPASPPPCLPASLQPIRLLSPLFRISV